MANFGINDIKKVSLTLTGSTFGSFTLRTYGTAGTSIDARPADDGAMYYANYGAGGQALFSKSYKPKNMEIEVNVLRLSEDYANMQKIVAMELAGNQVVFSCTYLDDNNGETITSNTAVLMSIPSIQTGADLDPDATYLIALSDATYTSPEGSII